MDNRKECIECGTLIKLDGGSYSYDMCDSCYERLEGE